MDNGSVVDIAIECLLAGGSDKEPDERHHCRRVESLCAMTAEELGWDAEDVSNLRLAALLHHMDRRRIPASSLAPSVAALLDSLVKHASEPETRTSRQRSRNEVGAGIIAMTDTFDRLTSPQRYRRPLTDADAMKILRYDIGSAYDSAVVDAFCRAYTRASQGSLPNAA